MSPFVPLDSAAMEVEAHRTPVAELHADLHATAFFEGVDLAPEFASAPGAGDAEPAFKKLSVAFPEDDARLAIVGLGKAED